MSSFKLWRQGKHNWGVVELRAKPPLLNQMVDGTGPGAVWKQLSHCFTCGVWGKRSKGSPHNTWLNIFKVTNQATKLLNKMFYLPTLTKYLLKALKARFTLEFLDFLELARTWLTGELTYDPRALAYTHLTPPPVPSFLFLTLSCTGGPSLLSGAP